LKEHVQILNPLPGKRFRSIRAGRFEIDFARSNLPPGFGEVWCFLTMWKKQKTPQILIYRAFGAFWLELNYLICDPAGILTNIL
jgi:hypothetical protein